MHIYTYVCVVAATQHINTPVSCSFIYINIHIVFIYCEITIEVGFTACGVVNSWLENRNLLVNF